MADIKFHCPECDQRLVVDESASGMQIACPQCQAALVIPASASASVKVLARRLLATPAGASGSAYEELERKQSELSTALEDAARLRAESERSKSELVRLREDLAAAADRFVTPGAVPEAERVRSENEQLRGKLSEAETARDFLAEQLASLDVQSELARLQETLAAVTAERDRLKVETVQAREASRDFDTAKATLARRDARIDDLTMSEAAFRRERDELRGRLAEAQTQGEAVAQALKKRETDVEELQRRLAGTAAEREAALLQLTEQQEAVSNLTLVNFTALRQADDFRAEVARLTDVLNARTLECNEATQALADREDSLRSASLTMAAAKQEMERLSQESATLSHEQAQWRGQFDEAAEEARELQLRVDSLLDDLHAREREVAEGRELLRETTSERNIAWQRLAEKEDELRETSARLDATHRYAETKLLETQQDAEAKVEAAQRDAETRIANAQRMVNELLAAKQDLEAKLAATETMVADGTARFEALRQASDAERGAVAKEREDFRHRVEQLIGDLHAREAALADASRQVEAHTALRDGLHSQLGAKVEELARLAAELEAARRETGERLEIAREQAAGAQLAAATKLEDTIREHETSLESAREVAAGAQRAAATKLEDTIREHEASLESAREQAAGAQRAAATKLEDTVREHEARLESAREQAAGDRRAADTKLAETIREHEARLAAQREEAAQAARTAKESCDRLERELSAAKKHAEVLESRTASLQADLQRSEDSVEQTRTELQAAHRAQKKAAEALGGKEQQIAELLVQLAAAHEAEKTLRTRAAEKDTEFQTVQENQKTAAAVLNAREQQNAELLVQLAAAREAEKVLRARAADAEQELRSRLEAAEKAAEEARQVAAERDHLAGDFQQAKADLVAFHETVRGARQERDAMRLNVDSMELQLEESLDQVHAGEAERDALKAELEAVRAGLERAKQHVNVLQSRRDQMREEIARLKLQLGQSPDAAA